ncbi:sugar ABC transporter ATP-binding protein [Arenivirga flava]|uniref:Sugar ABC transporter ATP-binding protein n=1 Tax=Arenivirga flava TaxID=1930060 RepID=A0AA37UAP7_9MICO|nr:sugar ABC transporter ATP-binding protein [Arenivirga flava]GMA27264.1 sugar ABC transporter ATP-binding protein [Arenivirga flava]
MSSEPDHGGPGEQGVTPVLSARSVVQRFGATTALAGVDLEVRAGEVLGLVGANGAGKSTLMAVLAGLLAPTEGRVEVDGEPVVLGIPAAADRHGIALVPQHVETALVPELSVAENLVLFALARGELGPLPGRRRIRAAARAIAGDDLLQRAGIRLDARAGTLRTAQAQQLLIRRALHRGARVLILDEPTAALSVTEQRELHEQVRRLAAEGTAVVYITHHLAEFVGLADRVVALREGRVVDAFDAPIEPARLVSAILGPIEHLPEERPVREAGEVVLALRGLRSRADAPPVDLQLRRGEVLGITGLLGAGKTELLRQVVGAEPLVDGTMTLDGTAFAPRHPADAIARGIGFVPEDRRRDAELPEWDLVRNTTLAELRPHHRFGLLSARSERSATAALIRSLGIVAAGPRALLSSLSGGNRQKVVVARWLAAGSRVLVLDEPFRGVDLGARGDIGALIRSSAVEAALVASSDPEEILEVADRIVVLAGGAVVGEFRPDELDEARLAELLVTSTAKDLA